MDLQLPPSILLLFENLLAYYQIPMAKGQSLPVCFEPTKANLEKFQAFFLTPNHPLQQVLWEHPHLDLVIDFHLKSIPARSFPTGLLFMLQPDKNNREAGQLNQFLLLNAYYMFNPYNIRLQALSLDQTKAILAIVKLYHRNDAVFLQMLEHFFAEMYGLLSYATDITAPLRQVLTRIMEGFKSFKQQLSTVEQSDPEKFLQLSKRLQRLKQEYQFLDEVLIENAENSTTALEAMCDLHQQNLAAVSLPQSQWHTLEPEDLSLIHQSQRQLQEVYQKSLSTFEELLQQVIRLVQACREIIKLIEVGLLHNPQTQWDKEPIEVLLENLYQVREEERLFVQEMNYFFDLIRTMHRFFPQGEFRNVPGFCRITSAEDLRQSFAPSK